jgi:CDP-diacylglycerol--glycerol-3-phosphate 3-phosphatidyltransferase
MNYERSDVSNLTIPNALSVLRILLAPVLLLVAWHGYAGIFLLLWLFTYFTDALDGFIARHFNQMSALGPKLDTAADFAIYMASPLAIWWLWPDLVEQELGFFGAVILSILLPPVIGFIKFRRMTSYHTFLVKIAIVLVVFSLVYLFLDGSPWPFRLATLVAVAAAAEEIALTWLLTEPCSDVRSIWRLHQRDHRP